MKDYRVWHPHRDYTGEEMPFGVFRDPPPVWHWYCETCDGNGDYFDDFFEQYYPCETCGGSGESYE